MRGRGLLSVAVGVLLGLVISHALAEEVVEAWRSAPPAFSEPYSVSVNPTDGSCWVADTNNSQVVHLSAAGAELWRSASGAFNYPPVEGSPALQGRRLRAVEDEPGLGGGSEVEIDA